MSYLLPASLDGTTPVQVRGEYTSNYVADAFNQQLQSFVDLFNLGITGDAPTKQMIIDGGYGDTSTAAGSITQSLETLISMAKNGVLESTLGAAAPGDTSPKDYLNTDMVASLNEIIKTVKAAGGTINMSTGAVSFTSDDAVNWKNLAVNSQAILQIMTDAEAQVSQNRTLQALVELIYVKTGNDLLSQNLQGLDTALSTTSDSLKTLTQLQDLLNRVKTTTKTQTFSQFAAANYNQTTPTAFMQGSGNIPGIVNQASKFFTQLAPTVNIASLTSSDTALFLDLRNQLIQQISLLTHTTPGADTKQDSGSLLDKLRTVKTTMDSAINQAGLIGSTNTPDIKKAMRLWILDNRNSTAAFGGLSSGTIQRDLTAAISAGQSLNDTQKEEVRRYLFVFEEYYKSASAVLNKITQLIERMAQGIAR